MLLDIAASPINVVVTWAGLKKKRRPSATTAANRLRVEVKKC